MLNQPPWLETFTTHTPQQDTVACVWLGQAGYLFKTDQGTTVLLDPYLSDYAETMWGLRRAIPPAFDMATFTPDILLTTHWHEDHLDMPVIRHYATQPGVTLVGPPSCTARAPGWGWDSDRVITLGAGDTVSLVGIGISATFARHETPEAPALDAVGFALTLSGLHIWNVGDTEYDSRVLTSNGLAPNVMLVPINGVGGNLDADEAALLTWKTQPRVVIPNHYNMWSPEDLGPGATLDPAAFAATLERLGGGPEVRVLEVGEVVTFGR